jgi:hypothetical protein
VAGSPRPEEIDMTCEHLICASCLGPVSEGRCPACKAARAHVHHHGGGKNIPLAVAALIALVLLTLAFQLAH